MASVDVPGLEHITPGPSISLGGLTSDWTGPRPAFFAVGFHPVDVLQIPCATGDFPASAWAAMSGIVTPQILVGEAEDTHQALGLSKPI